MSRECPCVYYDNEKCTLHGSDLENIDWCVMGPCSHETPSNADHIRSMTDEELAKILSTACLGCPVVGCKLHNYASYGCEKAFANWLKQPYKEDT